ncbi:calcium/sodium antiporter [Nanoarchaeota archaeon]
MEPILIWIIVFVVSLIALIKSSDYFTNSAEKIGLFFKLPKFIIGVTIVAIGTSLPELASSIYAVIIGNSEIVVGNVVGSNIANIFLVLGVAAIVGKRLKITHELLHVDIPFFVGSAFLLAVTIWDGSFGIADAIISLFVIVVYSIYTIQSEKKPDPNIKKEMKSEIKKIKKFSWVTLVVLVVSAAFIFVSSRYVIESVIQLSQLLNIGAEIIAVSAVALGTSLPELMVSLSAARNGKPEIAIGNVLGSNIFNSLAVMGIPAFFGTLVIPANILAFSLPMMIIATLLYFFMTQIKVVTKWEGWLLLAFYVFFLGKLFNFF